MKMQKKILTISIASYNIEMFIEDTVNSLIIGNDYFGKLEVIIVNDGSHDETSALAHDLASKYPETIIVLDKENGGYGSTINSSLSIAKGKYYKLLDGDDWFNTKDLVGFLEYLEKCDADIVITPYYVVRETDTLIDTHQDLLAETTIIEDLRVRDKFFAMQEITVKTDVFRAYNKPITEHCFYTDTEYILYCFMAANTIARYSKPIYRYRLGLDGQSMSLTGMRRHYRDCIIVSERMIEAFTDVEKEIQKSKKAILAFCIQRIVHHTFYSYLLLEEPILHRKELIGFDKNIRKKYPKAYLVCYRAKLVCLTRLLHFSCYTVLSRLAMRKYKKEHGLK